MSLIDDILYKLPKLKKNWLPVRPVAVVGGQMPPAAMQASAAGWEMFRCMDVDESVCSAQEIKGSGGVLGGIMAINEDPDSTLVYVKLYCNPYGSVTVGTDTPWLSPAVPYNGGAAGFILNWGWPGIPFSNGLTVAGTTGRADGSTDGPADDVLSVHAWYI